MNMDTTRKTTDRLGELPPRPPHFSPAAVSSTPSLDDPIHILIVDDEPKNLVVLETVLDDPGYRLVRAESADQALLALVAQEFALLILDIRMPGMTGFELAQMIKERKKTARVPIIFLTAYYNEDQHVLEGYDTGAVDYLHKPVNPAVLRSKVAVFAELYRKNRELSAVNRNLFAEVAERGKIEEQLRELNETLEQRVAERTEALRASEHFLQHVTAVTPDVIRIFDLDEQRSVFANRTVAAILGYSPAEVPLTGFVAPPELLHPEDAPRVIEHLRRVRGLRDGEITDLEYRVRDRRGDWHWFHSREAVFARNAAGSVSRIIGTAVEVTERKRTELEFQEHQELLRTVTDEAQVGLVVISDEHRYLYANRAYVRLFDLPVGEIVGAPVGDILPTVYASQIQPQLERAFAGERVTYELAFSSPLDPAGEKLLVITYQPQFEHKVVKSVVVVVVDLTDRKRMEQALRDADRRKDEFLATLAHELRNPLAPVRNAVQVLSLATPSDSEMRWARDIIDRQTQQMARLIDDLLDVSRISRGKLQLRRERLELSQVIQWAVETSRPLIDQQQHRLTVQLPESPVVLNGDLTRLSQVFMNLLNNAAKYSEQGGRIELNAERSGGEVIVSIHDDGIGIPAANLPGIFEMFSQVEGTLFRSQGGLGIGLCLVKRLVELHGGSVSAASPGRGAGSTFTIRLPLADDAVDELSIETKQGKEASSLSQLRVLVVDDNWDGAMSLSTMLTMLGNVVHIAHDGREAIEAAERYRPDLILMDIGMPRLNGLEATVQIRDRAWGRDMLIIALSGWGQETDKVRSREAGCDGHLVKPIGLAELETLLNDLRSPKSNRRGGDL